MKLATLVLSTATILTLGGALVAQSTTAGPKTLSDIIRKDWAGSAWNDGKAEVAVYDAERVIYGASRPHTLRLITVTEDFNTEFWTKADWPYGDKPTVPVLKQNQVAVIPTPNYDYNYMGSVFFDRTDIAKAVKFTITSQEWCGTTMKEFQFFTNPTNFIYNSYWDGQGAGSKSLPTHDENTYLEEELPLLVRTINFQEGLEVGLFLQPNQTTTRADIPEPSAAILSVDRPDSAVETAAGVYDADSVWRVTIRTEDDRRIVFQVADDSTNTLLTGDYSDGRRFSLADLERRAYWRLDQ